MAAAFFGQHRGSPGVILSCSLELPVQYAAKPDAASQQTVLLKLEF
jgi:hypothetical protein